MVQHHGGLDLAEARNTQQPNQYTIGKAGGMGKTLTRAEVIVEPSLRGKNGSTFFALTTLDNRASYLSRPDTLTQP